MLERLLIIQENNVSVNDQLKCQYTAKLSC